MDECGNNTRPDFELGSADSTADVAQPAHPITFQTLNKDDYDVVLPFVRPLSSLPICANSVLHQFEHIYIFSNIKACGIVMRLGILNLPVGFNSVGFASPVLAIKVGIGE